MDDRERPLITIILLCYNQERFVAEAVQGVLSQTYRPLEIIIFDDCSPDRTAETIERVLAAQPTRSDVRFIRNGENLHSNMVVRIGLEMAKGEFIFVSHGDDIMFPQMVEEMATIWLQEDVSLITANAHFIDANSQPLNRSHRDPNQPAHDTFESLARDGTNACCFGPTIGFERAVYEKFGWVPRYLRAYDIMYPFYAYLLKGAKFINTPLLNYRLHGHNTSASLRLERASARERALLEERMYISHLAHATLMEEVLIELCQEAPDRYNPIANRILPLVNVQLAEMAKKLVRASRQAGTLAST